MTWGYCGGSTDGLKENNKAALAVIFPAKVYSQKLPYGTSIYTAELLAIRAALQYISKFSIKTSIIFTDSLSAVQSLESQKLHQSLILSILTVIHHLHLKNYDVGSPATLVSQVMKKLIKLQNLH